jgi:hypothetical protein
MLLVAAEAPPLQAHTPATSDSASKKLRTSQPRMLFVTTADADGPTDITSNSTASTHSVSFDPANIPVSAVISHKEISRPSLTHNVSFVSATIPVSPAPSYHESSQHVGDEPRSAVGSVVMCAVFCSDSSRGQGCIGAGVGNIVRCDILRFMLHQCVACRTVST